MSGQCVECGADFQGDPIPQEYIAAGYYSSGTTHYSRVIGFEVPGVYDGVLYWACPDCGHAWARDFGIERRDAAARKHAAAHNERRAT